MVEPLEVAHRVEARLMEGQAKSAAYVTSTCIPLVAQVIAVFASKPPPGSLAFGNDFVVIVALVITASQTVLYCSSESDSFKQVLPRSVRNFTRRGQGHTLDPPRQDP